MDQQSKQKRIRVAMSQEQHDCVRLAAAMRREPMTEFCRDVILREAALVTEGMKTPDNVNTKPQPKRRSKK